MISMNTMRMLTWMCGVTEKGMTRNVYIKGPTRVTQTSRTITKIRQKQYGHMMGMEDEDIVRRVRNAR